MTAWPFAPLMAGTYGAILADPPWAYVMRSEKGHAKSPEAHYATLSMGALKALPVGELAARDAYLFMWSTWPHLPQALDLMQVWGFGYVTGGAWIKRTRAWKLAFGTGFVLRSASEPFLVGKVGAPRIKSRSVRNVIEADELPNLIESIRREHSRKPPQMREMIGQLLPESRKCELFGRARWRGNDVWGNQVGRFDD